MKFFDKFKKRVKELKKEIKALYFAYKNPKTGFLPKLIILFTIGYALSPVDLIPDFIPVLGYLDDLIIVPLLISLSVKLIPKNIMEESRIKAQNEPLKLGKNWFFGIFFILIWIALFLIFLMNLINIFKK